MSFIEQERALFDLLFNSRLRDSFISEGSACLTDYNLEPAEVDDFNTIRPDALTLDARIRTNLVVSKICSAYPVSFTLISSLPNGIEQLRNLVTAELMRLPQTDRNQYYGKLLNNNATGFNITGDTLRQKTFAFVASERGMAITAASLKEQVINGNYDADSTNIVHATWKEKTIKLAPFVSATILPISYMTVKKSICMVDDLSLWKQLGNTRLKKNQFEKALSIDDPRLFVTRAYLKCNSAFDPVIDQKTIELPEGFGFLFQSINGNSSVSNILEQMKQTGAEDNMLNSIQSAFKQLIELGMLTHN